MDAHRPAETARASATARAQAWRDGAHKAICDLIEDWEHGKVVRASRYPHYFDFNVVRVEQGCGLDVDAFESLADRALAGLGHRRVDFDLLDTAQPLRGGFEARGWTTACLLWMRHERPAAQELDARVEPAPYDAAQDLRVIWHTDFGDRAAAEYHLQAREVALRRGVQVLVIREGSEPVAFAQLERDGAAAEITQVYVHPGHRGRGLGRAITRDAIVRASDAEDLWICADDEHTAKDLYARLGFVPVWRTMHFLRQLDADTVSGAG